MHDLIQYKPSRIKYKKTAHLYPARYILSISLGVLYILRGCKATPELFINFKVLAFLTSVATTKCVKFQNPRCRGFKFGIFWII